LVGGDPLERPVWSALSTRQAKLAQGDARAMRFEAAYGAFAAAADASPESQSALAALPHDRNGLILVETTTQPAPEGMEVTFTATCVQMVAEAEVAEAPPAFNVIELSDADAPEMLALATLTRPGPFFERTHQLGPFIGARVAGELVAMAGERMQPQGMAELSGVCVHPDHRGKGYAAALSSLVARRISARGETPFLHAMADNLTAIRLYGQLGFTLRREVMLTVLRSRRA
jgi:predicted GNAT family acetyltransferase